MMMMAKERSHPFRESKLKEGEEGKKHPRGHNKYTDLECYAPLHVPLEQAL